MLPLGDGPIEFVAWNDKDKTSAKLRNLKTGRDLKCYIKYLHALVGVVLRDEEWDGEEDKRSSPQMVEGLGSVN